MATNIDDVKVTVSGLLISSKTTMTIEELQSDYFDFEGEHLPYRKFGFNSVIELLQNMPDVLKLPSDPNEFSKLTLIVNDKSSDIREFAMKQKLNNTTRNNNRSHQNGKNQIESDKVVPAIYPDTAFYNQIPQASSHLRPTTNNGFNNSNKSLNMKKGSKQFGLGQFNNTNEMKDFFTNSKFNDQHNDTGINDNFKLFGHTTGHIPKKVLVYIFKLFETVCSGGVTIENFKFIYNAVFHSILDPTVYGFTTDLQMFNVLNGKIIKIKNGVLFTKRKDFDFDTFYKNNTFNENEQVKQDLIGRILSKTPDISINIKSKIQHFALREEHEVIMGEAYNPSLFFIQYKILVTEFQHLMNNMLTFYEEENTKFCVEPELIIPGLIFVCSYTTYLNIKEWRRIRILKEVDQKAIEVFHVDYGLVQIIPKADIRLLKSEFSKLPCQAIHCCLTGYSRVNVIPRKLTEAFFDMTLNKKLKFIINSVNILSFKNYEYNVYNVTLYKTRLTALYTNINEELTYKYLAEYKAAKRYNAFKRREEAGVSDSIS